MTLELCDPGTQPIFPQQVSLISARLLPPAANIGDVRAVLCRGGKAEVLTLDHRAEDAAEKARIEKAVRADTSPSLDNCRSFRTSVAHETHYPCA